MLGDATHPIFIAIPQEASCTYFMIDDLQHESMLNHGLSTDACVCTAPLHDTPWAIYCLCRACVLFRSRHLMQI